MGPQMAGHMNMSLRLAGAIISIHGLLRDVERALSRGRWTQMQWD